MKFTLCAPTTPTHLLTDINNLNILYSYLVLIFQCKHLNRFDCVQTLLGVIDSSYITNIHPIISLVSVKNE